MREIKFRAWNKKDKEMVDLYKITPLALDSALDMDGLFLPFAPEFDLEQYTGVKDKNGKEIYEGDILRWEYWPYEDHVIRILVVKFEDGHFNVPTVSYSDNIKVIGNIYGNPELLEREEP